jgi:hypothetical protein
MTFLEYYNQELNYYHMISLSYDNDDISYDDDSSYEYDIDYTTQE